MTDKLFFDTDCISAFLWVKEENILFKLYPGKIILPKPVFNELNNPSIPHIKRKVNELCLNGDVMIYSIWHLRNFFKSQITNIYFSSITNFIEYFDTAKLSLYACFFQSGHSSIVL